MDGESTATVRLGVIKRSLTYEWKMSSWEARRNAGRHTGQMLDTLTISHTNNQVTIHILHQGRIILIRLTLSAHRIEFTATLDAPGSFEIQPSPRDCLPSVMDPKRSLEVGRGRSVGVCCPCEHVGYGDPPAVTVSCFWTNHAESRVGVITPHFGRKIQLLSLLPRPSLWVL